MYFQRAMESTILKASQQYPVILVCGQRQVGKSTMLNHIKEPSRRYVSFDDRAVRRLAETDPALFFETYGYPILIDEFQKVPSILETIRDIVGRLGYEGKDNNGLFWLTGSQKFKMMKGVSESLAGRLAVFEMSSLSIGTRGGYSWMLCSRSRCVKESEVPSCQCIRGLSKNLPRWYAAASYCRPRLGSLLCRLCQHLFREGRQGFSPNG